MARQAVPLSPSTPDTFTSTSTPSAPRDTSPEPPTSFLSLAPELRHEVYTYLFATSTLSCGMVNPQSPCRTYTVCTCAYPSQITRVNRQLRYETLPLLHAATTLAVQGSLHCIWPVPLLLASRIATLVVHTPKLFRLDGFDFSRLAALRTFEVRNVVIWCYFYDEVFLESAQADLTMLDMALFNVQRANRELAEVCRGKGEDRASKSRTFRVLLHCQFVVNSLRDETIHALINVDDEKILSKMRGPPEKNLNAWSGFY